LNENLEHIRHSDSLVTPHEQTRAGFVALALEKNRKATPFVEEAKALKALASKVRKPASKVRKPAVLHADYHGRGWCSPAN